jgi:hypothetical protein
MTGMSALDVGCNVGFFSFKLRSVAPGCWGSTAIKAQRSRSSNRRNSAIWSSRFRCVPQVVPPGIDPIYRYFGQSGAAGSLDWTSTSGDKGYSGLPESPQFDLILFSACADFATSCNDSLIMLLRNTSPR